MASTSKRSRLHLKFTIRPSRTPEKHRDRDSPYTSRRPTSDSDESPLRLSRSPTADSDDESPLRLRTREERLAQYNERRAQQLELNHYHQLQQEQQRQFNLQQQPAFVVPPLVPVAAQPSQVQQQVVAAQPVAAPRKNKTRNSLPISAGSSTNRPSTSNNRSTVAAKRTAAPARSSVAPSGSSAAPVANPSVPARNNNRQPVVQPNQRRRMDPDVAAAIAQVRAIADQAAQAVAARVPGRNFDLPRYDEKDSFSSFIRRLNDYMNVNLIADIELRKRVLPNCLVTSAGRDAYDAIPDVIRNGDDWEALIQSLQNNIYTEEKRLNARNETSQLKQNDRTVAAFAKVCKDMIQISYPGDNFANTRDVLLLSTFMMGLRQKIRTEVMRSNPANFEAALGAALREESIMRLNGTPDDLKFAISSLTDAVHNININRPERDIPNRIREHDYRPARPPPAASYYNNDARQSPNRDFQDRNRAFNNSRDQNQFNRINRYNPVNRSDRFDRSNQDNRPYRNDQFNRFERTEGPRRFGNDNRSNPNNGFQRNFPNNTFRNSNNRGNFDGNRGLPRNTNYSNSGNNSNNRVNMIFDPTVGGTSISESGINFISAQNTTKSKRSVIWPLLVSLALFAPLSQAVPTNQTYYDCSASKGGVLLAPPKPADCQPPKTADVQHYRAALYVKNQTKEEYVAWKCTIEVYQRCATSRFLIGPSYLNLTSWERPSLEECETAKSERTWKNLHLRNALPYQYKTEIQDIWPEKGFWTTDCVEVRRMVLEKGTVMSISADVMITTLITNTEKCLLSSGNCSTADSIMVWNAPQTPKPCNYILIGTFESMKGDNDMIVESLESSFTLLKGPPSKEIINCFSGNITESTNGAIFHLIEEITPKVDIANLPEMETTERPNRSRRDAEYEEKMLEIRPQRIVAIAKQEQRNCIKDIRLARELVQHYTMYRESHNNNITITQFNQQSRKIYGFLLKRWSIEDESYLDQVMSQNTFHTPSDAILYLLLSREIRLCEAINLKLTTELTLQHQRCQVKLPSNTSDRITLTAIAWTKVNRDMRNTIRVLTGLDAQPNEKNTMNREQRKAAGQFADLLCQNVPLRKNIVKHPPMFLSAERRDDLSELWKRVRLGQYFNGFEDFAMGKQYFVADLIPANSTWDKYIEPREKELFELKELDGTRATPNPCQSVRFWIPTLAQTRNFLADIEDLNFAISSRSDDRHAVKRLRSKRFVDKEDGHLIQFTPSENVTSCASQLNVTQDLLTAFLSQNTSTLTEFNQQHSRILGLMVTDWKKKVLTTMASVTEIMRYYDFKNAEEAAVFYIMFLDIELCTEMKLRQMANEKLEAYVNNTADYRPFYSLTTMDTPNKLKAANILNIAVHLRKDWLSMINERTGLKVTMKTVPKVDIKLFDGINRIIEQLKVNPTSIEFLAIESPNFLSQRVKNYLRQKVNMPVEHEIPTEIAETTESSNEEEKLRQARQSVNNTKPVGSTIGSQPQINFMKEQYDAAEQKRRDFSMELLNRKLQYATEILNRNMKDNFEEVYSEICREGNRHQITWWSLTMINPVIGVRTILNRPDVYGAYVGSKVLAVSQCQHVKAREIVSDHKINGTCFINLPIITQENITMFVQPGTMDVAHSSPEIDCRMVEKYVYETEPGIYHQNGESANVTTLETNGQVSKPQITRLSWNGPDYFKELRGSSFPMMLAISYGSSLQALRERQNDVIRIISGNGIRNGEFADIGDASSFILNSAKAKITETVDNLANAYITYIIWILIPFMILFGIGGLIFLAVKLWLWKTTIKSVGSVAFRGVNLVDASGENEEDSQEMKPLRKQKNSSAPPLYPENNENSIEREDERRPYPYRGFRYPELLTYVPIVMSMVCSVDSKKKRTPLPYIQISLKDRSLTSLWDSGSNISFLSLTTYRYIGSPPLLDREIERARTANGTSLNFLGSCIVNLRIAGYEVQQEMLIAEDEHTPGPVLLGIDLMAHLGTLGINTSLRPHEGTLIVGDRTLKLKKAGQKAFLETDRQVGIESIDAIDIRPGQTRTIRIRAKENISAHETLLIQAIGKDKSERILFHPLNTNITKLQFTNNRKSRIKLCPGDEIGFAQVMKLDTFEEAIPPKETDVQEEQDEIEYDEDFEGPGDWGEPVDAFISPEADFGNRTLELDSKITDFMSELDLTGCKLSLEDQEKLKDIILENKEAFANEDGKIGCLNTGYTYEIEVQEGVPLPKSRTYKQPICQEEEIEEHIQLMYQRGIIEPSDSLFYSPLLMVKKADATWRAVVDYRALNQILKPTETNLMPDINGLITKCMRGKLLTQLDLRFAFHQLLLDPSSRDLTSFCANRKIGDLVLVRRQPPKNKLCAYFNGPYEVTDVARFAVEYIDRQKKRTAHKDDVRIFKSTEEVEEAEIHKATNEEYHRTKSGKMLKKGSRTMREFAEECLEAGKVTDPDPEDWKHRETMAMDYFSEGLSPSMAIKLNKVRPETFREMVEIAEKLEKEQDFDNLKKHQKRAILKVREEEQESKEVEIDEEMDLSLAQIKEKIKAAEFFKQGIEDETAAEEYDRMIEESGHLVAPEDREDAFGKRPEPRNRALPYEELGILTPEMEEEHRQLMKRSRSVRFVEPPKEVKPPDEVESEEENSIEY